MPTDPSAALPYAPRRASTSRFVAIRHLHYHLRSWGDESLARAGRPPLVLLHGWMDVGASFQFLVDALDALEPGEPRWVLAPDWRGFGLTANPNVDSYWFPDYLADLDALLDALGLTTPVDLAGHSMGGNVVMQYAGVRPERIRRLVNLEGFGMPDGAPAKAPARLRKWLDTLKEPQTLRTYASLEEVAERLRQTNPRLPPAKAAWLAPHWAARREDDGRFHLLGDPAHKRPNPVLYRAAEHLAAWGSITAPVLWIEGDDLGLDRRWAGAYTRDEFHRRFDVVRDSRRERLADCGHMLHHDQPEALARLMHAFLG